MTRDLTRGSILKNLLMISIPTMIGFSAQMIYDIVDIFWLGRISGQAIAGVTIFSTIFWIVESLNEVIGVSSISLISNLSAKKIFPGRTGPSSRRLLSNSSWQPWLPSFWLSFSNPSWVSSLTPP